MYSYVALQHTSTRGKSRPPKRIRPAKGYRPGPCPRPIDPSGLLCGVLHHVAQDVLQDAAMPEIFDLVERVDPACQGHRRGLAVRPMDRAGDIHARLDAAFDPRDVEA